MKSTFVCAVMAMGLSAGGLACAQASNYETRQDAERNARAQQHQGQQDRRRSEARHPGRPPEHARAHGARRQDERRGGPDHALRQGQRLPSEYRHRHYVVDDWRRHHLHRPPPGHHWVQVGADYVLVAIATGVIVQLLLNN